ncbi:MAG: hypothetical protein ACFFAY_09780 [Promethearchaeota archaeon]
MLDISNPSAQEVEIAIWMYYERRFKDQHSETVLDYPDAINDDDFDRLTSEMARMKSNRITSKRIGRVKRSRPHLMTFYNEFMHS